MFLDLFKREKTSLFRKINSKAVFPVRSTEHSAGHDLVSLEGGVIRAGERAVIHTGIGWNEEFQEDGQLFFGLIKERSGHARYFGLQVLGGVVDLDYNNSITVILLNTGETSFHFDKGDKIAQLLVLPYGRARNEITVETQRDGGFGSTDSVYA